ncbi:NADH-quinone oxidoreductase subunit E [Tepiditoga spiralis]|uniref:NADH-quinone oxidoreductase subunit E n=1 Tax=Tepiditoga spiralis TaxID=2108365 RepID=A0A7G1G8K3_9BACT|nr:NAD(P)H-dependent oxidoreductase subunit E [Tepiditoga spiralis]BBE31564.1 NADH-quinone oxidoreductase subunit E [Tepiditoga spiralis]
MEKFFQKELLEELRDIQDAYGYIPEKEILRISKERSIPKANLFGTISFYSMLYTKPTGKYIIRLCDSVSCRLNGSNAVLNSIKDYLKIGSGETSNDLKFTLEVVECLGHCGEGPVMIINSTVYNYLTPEKAVNILQSLD